MRLLLAFSQSELKQRQTCLLEPFTQMCVLYRPVSLSCDVLQGHELTVTPQEWTWRVGLSSLLLHLVSQPVSDCCPPGAPPLQPLQQLDSFPGGVLPWSFPFSALVKGLCCQHRGQLVSRFCCCRGWLVKYSYFHVFRRLEESHHARNGRHFSLLFQKSMKRSKLYHSVYAGT